MTISTDTSLAMIGNKNKTIQPHINQSCSITMKKKKKKNPEHHTKAFKG